MDVILDVRTLGKVLGNSQPIKGRATYFADSMTTSAHAMMANAKPNQKTIILDNASTPTYQYKQFSPFAIDTRKSKGRLSKTTI